MLRVLDNFFNRFRQNKNIDNLNDRTTIMDVKDFQVVENKYRICNVCKKYFCY